MTENNTSPAAEHENAAGRAKENREAAVQRIVASGVGAEKVQGDHTYGWTAQQGPAPKAPDAIPGQVFVPRQLPDPTVQRAWGIDPDLHKAGLEVVSDEVGLSHPGGPEADEASRLGLVGSAYRDATPDARVADWMGGRDEESKTDLDEAVATEEANREEEKPKDVNVDGLSASQANAVKANVPAEDTGSVSNKDKKDFEPKKNARRSGRTSAEAGSQVSGDQEVK
jgi:hypothetical protein